MKRTNFFRLLNVDNYGNTEPTCDKSGRQLEPFKSAQSAHKWANENFDCIRGSDYQLQSFFRLTEEEEIEEEIEEEETGDIEE